MPRFKDPGLQKMYEAVLAAGADRRPGVRTAYWMENGERRKGSADRNAYFVGFDGHRSMYMRGTRGYAAWAAGRDAGRAARKNRT